jgi:hypothetical protein
MNKLEKIYLKDQDGMGISLLGIFQVRWTDMEGSSWYGIVLNGPLAQEPITGWGYGGREGDVGPWTGCAVINKVV